MPRFSVGIAPPPPFFSASFRSMRRVRWTFFPQSTLEFRRVPAQGDILRVYFFPSPFTLGRRAPLFHSAGFEKFSLIIRFKMKSVSLRRISLLSFFFLPLHLPKLRKCQPILVLYYRNQRLFPVIFFKLLGSDSPFTPSRLKPPCEPVDLFPPLLHPLRKSPFFFRRHFL